jgi:hypothetical protein
MKTNDRKALLSEAARILGAKGGRASADALTSEQRKARSSLGYKAMLQKAIERERKTK